MEMFSPIQPDYPRWWNALVLTIMIVGPVVVCILGVLGFFD